MAKDNEDEDTKTLKSHKVLSSLAENLEATAQRASAARLLCLDRSGLSSDLDFYRILRWGLLESIYPSIHLYIYIYICLSIYLSIYSIYSI